MAVNGYGLGMMLNAGRSVRNRFCLFGKLEGSLVSPSNNFSGGCVPTISRFLKWICDFPDSFSGFPAAFHGFLDGPDGRIAGSNGSVDALDGFFDGGNGHVDAFHGFFGGSNGHIGGINGTVGRATEIVPAASGTVKSLSGFLKWFLASVESFMEAKPGENGIETVKASTLLPGWMVRLDKKQQNNEKIRSNKTK
jgi:hypothetical protein